MSEENKTYSRCKKSLPLSSFGKRTKNKDGFKGQCKECLNEDGRERYRKDPEHAINLAMKGYYKRKDKVAKYKHKLGIDKKDMLNNLKVSTGCYFCTYTKSGAALDFHHVDPSMKNIKIGSYSHRKDNTKLFSEIRKCVVLCANCHRRLHAGEITLNILNDVKLDDNLTKLEEELWQQKL